MFNALTSCVDGDIGSSREIVYKNGTSYDIQYYLKDYYYEGKDSLLFELSPQSEIVFSYRGFGGDEDGGAVEDCCEDSLYGVQEFGSTELKYTDENEERCITYDYGDGPGDYLNYEIVKKGFNYFELTYTFTDSILKTVPVCE